MARQVLPWVGMAVGAYFGNPQLGFMIGSMVGNAVDPQTIKGPALGEGQNNSASEGGYRPIVLGKGAVGVCMIHEGPIKKRTIRTRQSKGGAPVTEEERAYRTMAFALGESAYPDTGVVLLRLWIDNKLRYDVTPTSQIVAESAEFADEFTFYSGTDVQLPDPDLESFMGAGNVPSYRGGSPYIVLPDWDVTSSQGRAPMIKAELASAFVPEIAPEWVITGGSGDGYAFYRSPTGIDSYVIDPSGPLASMGFYTADSEILGVGVGPTAAISRDGSYTWEDHNFSMSGTISQYSAARQGGAWWTTSTGGFKGKRIFNGVLYETEIDATSIAEQVGVIYGHGPSYSLYKYDATGAVAQTANMYPDGARMQGLYSSDGTMVLLWTNDDNLARLSTVSLDLAHTEVVYPGTGLSVAGVARLVSYSVGLELWVLVDGSRVYYGPSLLSLTLSSFVPEHTVHCIDDDGEKFIMGANNRTVYYSEDGDTWSSATLGALPSNRPVISIASTPKSSSVFGERIPLYTIASFIHDRVDIPAGKIDVTQLTDLVEGVVFADGYTGADAMRAAMGWYQFDAGEFDAGSGYRINYIKRGGAAEATLTDSDVVEGPEEWEREDSYERPRVLHIAYQNPVADYGAPVIPIKRTSHDVKVVGERSVAIPFVTSDQDEVARRGDVALTVIYTEIAGTVEVILPISWLALAPTNTIGYSLRARVRRLRMTDWRFSPDGTIKTEWIADRQSAFTSQLTALPAVPTTPPPPSIVGATVSAVLDIPALVDGLDTLHLYAAATGQTEGWWGSVHQRRLPWDTDYTTAATFTRPATIIGQLEAAITDASEHFTDTTNVVSVSLYQDDELQTFTQQQFLSENGAFALSWMDGAVRRWEIMQYRDAVKAGDQTWELTTLLRGRLNTQTAAHQPGALLVVLDSGIKAMAMQTAWIGEDITHRAVSNGQSPDQATPYTQEYTGQSQREWPVASIEAALDGDVLDVSYVPRHRFGTDDHPVRSVNWDGYRVSASDGVNTEAVDTLADFHTFDVTGWATPITVSVSQLNRFTGEGPAVTKEVA